MVHNGETRITFEEFCKVYTIMIGNQPTALRKAFNRTSERVGFEGKIAKSGKMKKSERHNYKKKLRKESCKRIILNSWKMQII